MRFDNTSFFHKTIVVDDNQYYGCSFTKCRIVCRGQGAVDLVDCFFKEPYWGVEDAAANTLKYLMALYHGAGEAGVKLVEATFQNIRKNRAP